MGDCQVYDLGYDGIAERTAGEVHATRSVESQREQTADLEGLLLDELIRASLALVQLGL